MGLQGAMVRGVREKVEVGEGSRERGKLGSVSRFGSGQLRPSTSCRPAAGTASRKAHYFSQRRGFATTKQGQ